MLLEGGGYAEDGREIFDDNDEDEEINELQSRKQKTASQNATKKKRLNPDIRSGSSPLVNSSVGRDIRTLFSSNQIYKKKKVVF